MANLLTGLRLLLVIPVCWGFAQPDAIAPWLVLGCILLAIATDYFDGKVARALGTASPAGMLFDHGTDFLFVTSSLTALAFQGIVPFLLPILIVIAFTQYVLDSYFLFRQKQLRMSFLGRWNGIFYFVPLIGAALAGFDFGTFSTGILAPLTRWLAYALMVSTIASIIDRGIAPLRRPQGL